MSDNLNNNTNLNTSTASVGSNKLSSLNLESSLCFPKEIFYAETFDVDAFLSHYKKEYSLERIRDDLNVFLKVLEMSMCELINKDYPDFVNLSTNLVDLDKAINDLKNPLETMKKDVDFVKNSIESEINQITAKLNEKLMIEKRRIFLKLLMNWQRSLKVTNEMIGNSQKINGDHLERIAFEFNQLKNSLSICSGENQDNLAQNNDINKLSQILEKIMQDLFLKCLNCNEQLNLDNNESSLQEKLDNSDNRQQLKHVLKSYALLSKQRLAEQLFTDNLVKPYLEKYINEDYLENNITKLDGVFDKVLEFIDQHNEFLRITNEIKSVHHTNNSNNSTSDLEELKNKNNTNCVNEFDFLINSIWSSLVSYLDLNLNIIFSPADADQFHQYFNISFEFLNKFESKCIQFDKQIKKKLYSSSSYTYFVKKWQIQVYYQIRFQEIVSKFEEDLQAFSSLNNDFLNEDAQTMDLNPNAFYLIISNTLVKQMEFCWNESKCFLKCLLDRFWKLNLQLVSRYCLFFTQLFENKLQLIIQTNSNADQLTIQADQQQQQQQPRPKTPTEISNTQSVNEQTNDLNLCVYLLNDVNKLWSIKLPNFFDGVIAPVIRSSNALKDLSLLKESFQCSLSNLSELQSNLIDYLVKYQSEKCLSYLKNANDIPRLYRRTNREIPKAPSQYIGFAIQVIHDFKISYSDNSNKCSERQRELIEKCLRNIIDIICSNDLLESVKKMEDSLKRLQRVRQTNRSSANLTSQSTNIMSDDDKIRLQLSLDINELGKQLEEKFDGYKGDSNFDPIDKLIDEINQCLNKDKTNNSQSNSNNKSEQPEQKQQNNQPLMTEENETTS